MRSSEEMRHDVKSRDVNVTLTATSAVVGFIVLIVAALLLALAISSIKSDRTDEVATGKLLIEKRGFTEATFLNAKTDGQHAFDDSIFTYDAKYRGCPITLTYYSFNGNITYVGGGGATNSSETISNVSVKSLDLLKRANFKNCTG